MLRRVGPRRDGGASLAEYAGLLTVAALILGALVAAGLPEKISTYVPPALCRILDGPDCGKQVNDGRNGGQEPTAAPSATDDPNDQASADDDGGDEPTLADLQAQANQAQQQLNTADDGGDIKGQIVGLLKDFVGITDVEKCFGDGDIASCLWALLDVGSLFAAVLKAGKFVKAIEKAVDLWKRLGHVRKAYDRLKHSAERLGDLLRRRKLACGLPAAFPLRRHAPPVPVVPASLHLSRGASAPYAKPVPSGGCGGLNPAEIADALAKAKDSGRGGLRAYEALGGHTLEKHVGLTVEELRARFATRVARKKKLQVFSSFTDFDVADRAVGDVLSRPEVASEIQDWVRSGATHDIGFTKDVGDNVGINVWKDGRTADTSKVRVLLTKDPASPTGFRVQTAYPAP